MTFILDDDHLAFQQEVRGFARTELLNGYHARAATTEFPHTAHKKLATAGLLDLCRSEADGGQGADLVALGLACEEVGYADPHCGYQLFSTNVLVSLLAGHDSPAVRDHATAVAAGDVLGCWGVTEPGTPQIQKMIIARALLGRDAMAGS